MSRKQLTLRLPEILDDYLHQAAKKDFTSKNAYLVNLIMRDVEKKKDVTPAK